MKARLIKKNGETLLLCYDGSIARATDNVLRQLFICFKSADTFTGTDGYWNDKCKNMESVKGNDLAFVDDENRLCIIENPFMPLIQSIVDEEYITLHEYAQLHNKNDNRIKALCRENRLIGATKKAGKWFIPKNAPYPKDARFSGIEK